MGRVALQFCKVADMMPFCGNTNARAYLNQVPWDQWLYVPSKECSVNFKTPSEDTTRFLDIAE